MDTSRRNFVLTSLGIIATAVVLPKTMLGQAAPAAPSPIVDEKEPLAASLGYHKDASKSDATKRIKRGATEGKDQFCHNCQLYAADKDGKGKCTLFTNRLVFANGWCSGWVAKAK
jgi:hypothetical protein